MIAFCNTNHSASLALAKKSWEVIILIYHSPYPKCHLRFQKNRVLNCACWSTALMGHSFTWCSPTRASWISALFCESSFILLALSCHSMILGLMSAMVDVCAWGFCLLQYLYSLKYVDTLLSLSDTDMHGSGKLHISLPVVLASCWVSCIQHYLSNHSAHKELVAFSASSWCPLNALSGSRTFHDTWKISLTWL